MSIIERASPADLAAILALLERCGLPQAGLKEVLATVVVVREAGRLVGCTALEVYGTTALLRSVAVDPIRRSHGLGNRLVQAALSMAQQLGIHEIYLLTETAEDYFSRFGFHRIERADASPAIHYSVEWTSACPASAQVMVLSLESEQRPCTG
jgi:amino-acid N-acetyltransferase